MEKKSFDEVLEAVCVDECHRDGDVGLWRRMGMGQTSIPVQLLDHRFQQFKGKLQGSSFSINRGTFKTVLQFGLEFLQQAS